MIEDDVLRQVRAARDAYAQRHNYDVRAMVADLQARNRAGDHTVVRRAPRRPIVILKSKATPVIDTLPALEKIAGRGE